MENRSISDAFVMLRKPFCIFPGLFSFLLALEAENLPPYNL
jgi:hypothetical protein